MSDNEDKPPLMSAGLQTFLWHRLVEVSGLIICALALGLLVMLRYMPLHHTSDPEALGPLSDLLDSSQGAP